MPRWPAYILLAALAACAYPAAVPQGGYRALGQEPGWHLNIATGNMVYVGNYGETRITRATPTPRTTFNGHRYEAEGLIVDVTHSRCNDAMSGHGYADTVMVIANGATVHGCGGERQPQFDS